jgi:tyrosinase
MEDNPHGSAHVSFSSASPITHIEMAPRDPLFFMLHANVDRLWATWQAAGNNSNRINPTNQTAYFFQGSANDPQAQQIGDNSSDTLWPWNNDTQPPRPRTAPGGPMVGSPFTAFPGQTPKVSDTIDYQGKTNKQNLLFDYDTIPFIN